MRAILLSLLASFSAPAWCEDDILAVLQRSQQMQLDALTEAQVDDADPAVQVVRRSFQRVLDAADGPGDVRLLVVRLEISNGEKEKAIREFLGLDRFQIVNANVGSEKNYAEQYAKFKSLVRLPKDYVGAICDSKFARHFYSPEVIEKARATWTQPSN